MTRASGVGALLLHLALAVGVGHALLGYDFRTEVVDLPYFANKTVTVDSNKEYVIHFPESNSKYPYTVYAWSHQAFFDHPVFIVVRQQKEVNSWEIPLPVDYKYGYLQFTSTSRTLCHNSMPIITEMARSSIYSSQVNFAQLNKKLSISLSTTSQIPTDVSILVEEHPNFYVEENQSTSVVVSPSQPRFFYYKFYDKDHANYTDSVILEVESEDDICLTVSVQNATCPVLDLNKEIMFKGKHQTVDTKGGIIIKQKDFPNGFFVVFVAKGDNVGCGHEGSIIPMPRLNTVIPLNRSSVVTFNIKRGISKGDYIVASLSTLGIIVIFYLVFGTTTWAFYRWGYQKKEPQEFPLENVSNRVGENSATDEIDSKLAASNLVLSDLARKKPEHFEKKSYAYLWHVSSIAIFYGIPVVQLVVTYQRVVNISGNQDICYYNFLCAHPLFEFSDFNHIYSNIGYILMGALFLLITFYKHNFVEHKKRCGIPKHYGLFYAMGVALIMEGVLSACYHVCPNQSNFQFDTSFMYVMATLCIIKLYQNRHPDINATAYATFVILGLAIFAAMIGVLNGHISLWITFIICYISLCIYVSFNIYFLSYVKRGVQGIVQEWTEDHNFMKVIEPKRKTHFRLLVVANILNVIFANLGILCYFLETDFATFLLALLMANAILYATVYIIMKIVYHERICAQAILFGVLSIITWIAGTFFFINNSTMWTVTPAESRQFNMQCVIMNFYDFHDIWHLLSAPALFFTFMLLLTLDDDLVHTPHDQIAVF